MLCSPAAAFWAANSVRHVIPAVPSSLDTRHDPDGGSIRDKPYCRRISKVNHSADTSTSKNKLRFRQRAPRIAGTRLAEEDQGRHESFREPPNFDEEDRRDDA